MDQAQCRAQLKVEQAGTPPVTITVEGSGNACSDTLRGVLGQRQQGNTGEASTGNNSGMARSDGAHRGGHSTLPECKARTPQQKAKHTPCMYGSSG
jgi:hypothetical protein